MKFHWPSFVLGVAAGAAGAAMWNRLRPLALEIATLGYELSDTVWARVGAWQEDAEDVLAEARGRAQRRGNVHPMRRPAAKVRSMSHAPRGARHARGRRSPS